ncbi:MAG TPA: HWE histidine kinase domain-containing protein, partial [Gammaproteobacteria bacterium]|nr:HWE histidine kinase domain-containing protein [Gammaproteobacteria bacterium]
ADFASIQSLDPGSGELRLLAQRGFIPGAAEFWMRVGPDGASTCAQALRSGRRVVVGDVEAEVSVAGSPDLELYRRTGIRALQSTPLVARGGRLLGMLSTHWGEPHWPSEDELDLFDVLARQAADFLERLEAHETLHASEARLRAIFDGTYEYIVLLNSEGRVLDANRAALDSGPWTREDLIGRPYPETPWFAGTPGAAEELRKALARAAAGEFVRYELAIARPAGEVLTFDFSLHPVSEEPGAAALIVAESRDISRRKQTEEHRQLLVNELNHRVKNTLATVQSLAIQTLAGSQLATEVAKTFEGRLLALAQTHNLLTSARWGDVGLRELLARELAPFGEDGDGRLAIAGDDALLRPKAALALGMALHELATNASRHGAWSDPAGRVRIDSALLDGGRGLRLEWKESGGPEVAKPHRRGFGTRLIQAGLTHELAGEVRIDYLPGGLHCAIEIPLASASGEAVEAQTRP